MTPKHPQLNHRVNRTAAEFGGFSNPSGGFDAFRLQIGWIASGGRSLE